MSEDDNANEMIQKAVQAEFIDSVFRALPVAFELVKYSLRNKQGPLSYCDLIITDVDVVERAFELVDEINAQYVERLREETTP